MKNETKNGYVAGLVSILFAAIILSMVPSMGLTTSGTVTLIFGLFFGGLGAGSLWKPDSIGAILAQIFENVSRNLDEDDRRSYNQKQHRSKNSPQIQTDSGKVEYHQHFYGPRKRKKRR
ncbi:MAG: hypothetical protein KAU24_01430 [Candidatus Aenigmarchaeota archaeon]|nr:hypothetical protein [Candidatus Aenigmarchaeota archaeon]